MELINRNDIKYTDLVLGRAGVVIKTVAKVSVDAVPTIGKTIQDPEDPATVWVEFPDGLRLIFKDGQYKGYYQTNLEAAPQ